LFANKQNSVYHLYVQNNNHHESWQMSIHLYISVILRFKTTLNFYFEKYY
jgi:hypothetical protein